MVEIGYAIDPAHRRRGYARAALETLLRRATDEPQVHTVRVTIAPDNLASYHFPHGEPESGPVPPAGDRISERNDIVGTARRAALIAECIRMLDIFRLSRQLVSLERILERLTDEGSACPPVPPAAAR